MQKKHTNSFVIAGRSFGLGPTDIEGAVRDLVPEPVRDHYVVVAGVRFPPKQIIAAVTGLDRADFVSNQARAILRRLGFATGRAGEARPGRAAESSPAYRASEADALRPHMGKWVAVKQGDVLVAADSPREVLAWLRTNGLRGDGMFRVPLDPSVDLGGFSG